MANNFMFKKFIFILIIILCIVPDALYAQSKPTRDTSKDNSVLLSKKKVNSQKVEKAKNGKTYQGQRSKKRKASVSKNATPTQATFLHIDQQTYQNQNFRYSGETKYFSVKTDGKTWNIASSPEWCVIRKYSDSFTVICNPNPYHDERVGSIRIVSDNKDAFINIKQPGTPLNIKAKFEDAYLRHNVYKDYNNYNCLEINANIVIEGAWGQKCLIVALFYDEYGNKILANSKYPNYALGSNKELYAAVEVLPTSDYPQKHTVSFYLPNDAMLFEGKKKKKNLQCRLYLYCEKTRTYIDGASYQLNFKAQKKKGFIKTKKRK